MKKQYIAPDCEHINFDVEDVITADLPIGWFTDETGAGTGGEMGTESGGYVSPWG